MKKLSERRDSLVLVGRLLMLAAFVVTLAGEALAARNPNWVGVRRLPVEIIRNPNESIPITAHNY